MLDGSYFDFVDEKFCNFWETREISEGKRRTSLARETKAKYRFLSKTNYRLATEEASQLLIQLVGK